MAINTGGSAFPTPTEVYPNGQVQYGDNGMTLRDYFAAKAIQGMCGTTGLDFGGPDGAAKIAYIIADAMLKAREGGAE